MKTIPVTFQSNFDKSGIATFTLIKKDDATNTYLYERKFPNYSCFEAFTARIVKAGSPLPDGSFVTEDYIQYPGSSQFGKGKAFSCNSLERAEIRFNELIEKANDIKPEVKPAVKIGVVRRGRVKAIRPAIIFPSKPFKMKDLQALNSNGWTTATLYVEVQNLIKSKVIDIVGIERSPSGKGVPAKIFQKN